MDEYSIEQRIELIKLFRELKKDVNTVIDGLITNNVQDHEVMLMCEQLIDFPELTYKARKMSVNEITFNTKSLFETADEWNNRNRIS